MSWVLFVGVLVCVARLIEAIYKLNHTTSPDRAGWKEQVFWRSYWLIVWFASLLVVVMQRGRNV